MATPKVGTAKRKGGRERRRRKEKEEEEEERERGGGRRKKIFFVFLPIETTPGSIILCLFSYPNQLRPLSAHPEPGFGSAGSFFPIKNDLFLYTITNVQLRIK